MKSAKKRKKTASKVPLGKIKSEIQRNTLIIQKETLRIQTQTKGSKKKKKERNVKGLKMN